MEKKKMTATQEKKKDSERGDEMQKRMKKWLN